MRLSLALSVILLICGCTQEPVPQKAAVIPKEVFFEEDFSSGSLSGFDVQSSGGALMQIYDNRQLRIDNAIMMRSQNARSVLAKAPDFEMDYSRDYAVYLEFMMQHRENYGYTVFQNRHVKIILEHGTGLSCVTPEGNEFLARFENNKWVKVGLEVMPRYGEYTVYLDGNLVKSCDFLEQNIETFVFGDPDPTDKIHGDGLWDNFAVSDML